MLDCVPTPCCPWERELLVPAFVVGERPDSYQHLQNEGFSEKGRESDVDHQNNNKYCPQHRTAPPNPSIALVPTSLFPQQMLFPLLGSLSCRSSGGSCGHLDPFWRRCSFREFLQPPLLPSIAPGFICYGY